MARALRSVSRCCWPSRWCFRWRCPTTHGAQGRGGAAPGAPDHARGDGPDRSHRLLGGDHLGRLALADDHAGQGRLRQHSAEPPGTAACRSVGSGEGRSRRRTVQGLRRAWPDARADAAAHHLAGRQHAQARDRLRHADAPLPLRRHAGAAQGAQGWQGVSTAQWIMAGGGRGRGGRALRLDEVRDDEAAARVPAEERRALQRQHVFTEYWDVHTRPNGDSTSSITNVVDDPVYLQAPWSRRSTSRWNPTARKWDPTPCDARF